MSEVATDLHCPACGAALSKERRSEGLCPACILELALESPSLMAELEAGEAGDGFGNADLDGSVAIVDAEASTLTYAREAFVEGQILGDRYRIRALLGRGGMGEVWRATDLKLRVDVALKALHRQLLDDRRALETLRQEVRLAREVVSPNVCRVFDLVELDGQELVSMEYIDGITLLHILKARAPLDLSEAREIAAQFLAGLEAIHAAGLVHRDVKPENLMMTRSGRVVLMDFGIAKGLQEGASATIAGTPAYMSPEQSRGEDLDARADVFSAGVVLAEMIAPGGLKTPDARQRIWKRIRQDPPAVAETPWASVLKSSLAAVKEQRYPTASALARALEEVTLRAGGDENLDPYPGLSSFTEEDAEYFFGRELEIEEMWKKLHRPHLLALIGPSGAGKSSFLRAGLLSVIPTGWGALVVTPGSRPFMALSQVLVAELAGDTEAMGELLRFDEPDLAVDVFKRWRRQHDQALLILDQFEELFTQNPLEVQERFSTLLSRLALEADIHVLLSMRDDFLFHCTSQEALAPIYSELTPLKPLSGTALRRALVQPALKCGYRFEDDTLVDEMVAEVADERGALPLLAFAAARLWSLRDREQGLLTREAYEHIGGVGGALAQHAEQTLERIGHDQIPTVREIFRNLVTAQGTRLARGRDELLSVFVASGARYPAAQEAPVFRSAARESAGDAKTGARGRPDHVDQALDQPSWHSDGKRAGQGSGTRLRKQSRPETLDHNRLPQDAATVLDALIDARLLTAYEEAPADDDGEPQQRIEIIHESLLSNWPRLVRWRTQDADSAQLKDQLRQAAQMWIERGRPEDLLWTGTSYKEYELWRERYEGGLSESEETFADAMKTAAERHKRRRRLAVAAVFTLLLGTAATLAFFWQRSESARKEAVAAERQAQASNLYGLAQMQPQEEPSAFLAYAAASLEQADNAEVRREIARALWRGPPGFRLPADSRDTVDFSPDGQWLATASRAEGIRLWPSDGAPPTLLEGSATGWEARRVRISPRGDVLAHDRATEGASPSQRRWREVVLWSVPDGRLLRSLKFDDGTTHLFSFSADGTQLFTITEIEQAQGGLKEVRSWPVAGGEPTLVARLGLDSWDFFDLTVVDPTGTRLAWRESGRLFVARSNGSTFDQRSAVEVVHPQDVVTFCFDSRGNKLATIDAEGAIRIWSLDTGLPQLDRTLVAKGSTFDWLRFDPSATWLVSRGAGIRNLEWPPDAEPWPLHFADRLFEDDVSWAGVSIQPEGRWLAGGNTASVSFWPLAGPYPFVLRGHEGEVMAVRYTPDGRWLISSGGDGTVRRWPLDPETADRSDLLHQVEPSWGEPKNLDLPPDGSFVVFATTKGRVAVLPFDGGPIRELPGFKDMITGLAVGPRGRFVAAGGGYTDKTESVARVWDLRTGEVHVLDQGNLKRVFVDEVHFTPEGELLVTTDKLRRWVLGDGPPRLVSEKKIDNKGVARGFSPDSRLLLVTEGGWGPLFVVDLETGTARALRSHSRRTNRAIFDPTGTIVVSADGDPSGAIAVGPVNGAEPHLLFGHESPRPEGLIGIDALAVSPDGNWIASGGVDGTIRLWPMPDLSQPPLHTLPTDELVAKLETLTNLRVIPDPDSLAGWKLEIGPFPGWEEVPTW